MESRQDLLTVANAAVDIGSADGVYDWRTREDAWGLWYLALERLEVQSSRLRKRSDASASQPVPISSSVSASGHSMAMPEPFRNTPRRMIP
jgi:hypothetical protein